MSYIDQVQDISQPVTDRGMATKKKLLEAADGCFGQRGFFPTSIVDITREAGVAPGTFYNYFSSKEAILRELVHNLNHKLRKATAIAIEGAPNRLEAERAGFRAFLEWVRNHRNSYRVVRQSEFVDKEMFRWYYRKLGEGYVQGLQAAMDAGEVAHYNPEVLAYCLMGIGDFMGMRYVLWQEEEVPEDVFEEMMRFILSGLERR